MKRTLSISMVMALFLLVPQFGSAQELIVFPAKGQTEKQMEQDKYTCYNWAKGQTGFDPMAPPTATAPPPKKDAPKGGVGKGAVRGGVLGAAVGSLSGEAGKGAAIGAAAGGLFGGMRRSNQKQKEQKAHEDWEKEQVRQYTQKRNTYNRAYSACLEGKGYTVK